MKAKVIRLCLVSISPEQIQTALDAELRYIEGPVYFATQSETRTLEDDRNTAWETITITIFYGE